MPTNLCCPDGNRAINPLVEAGHDPTLLLKREPTRYMERTFGQLGHRPAKQIISEQRFQWVFLQVSLCARHDVRQVYPATINGRCLRLY